MASHAPLSWNRTHKWLKEMESLRQSLSKLPGSAREVRISPAWEWKSDTPFPPSWLGASSRLGRIRREFTMSDSQQFSQWIGMVEMPPHQARSPGAS
jgi:hypothetical protein